MQLIFQTGAHSTEHERLLKCLLANKGNFAGAGVAVPGPGRYRGLLRKSLEAMEHASVAPGAREVMLDAILDGQDADRVLMSNTHFLGTQKEAFGDNTLYPLAGERVARLQQLFAHDQVEIFMAIRNPATFVPGALVNAGPAQVSLVMKRLDLHALRWSELFERIRQAAPRVPLTVWCNEDAPLIWGQILRDLAGVDLSCEISGEEALLIDIMSEDGASRYRSYLDRYSDMSERHRRRVAAAFLDKYALDDAVEEEIDLPGWTDELVDELTEIYDEDVFEIQRIPDVHFIAP